MGLAEMTEMMSLSEATVKRHTKDPTFPAKYKLGRAVRWERSEVEEWVRAHRVGADAPVAPSRPTRYMTTATTASDSIDISELVLIPA